MQDPQIRADKKPKKLMPRLSYQRPAKIRVALVMFAALQLVSCGSPEQRAQSYYDSGMKLLSAKDNEKAAIEFLNAVKLDKNLLPAWRGLAKAEEATRHWDRLIPALRTILQLDPNDEATRIKLGKILVAGGANDQALKLVNEVSQPQSQDADVLGLKAVILYKLKDNAAALSAAQAALGKSPSNVDALSVLAIDRLANNDPNGALQVLSASSLAADNDVGIQLIKLNIYEQLKDLPQIEAILRSLTQQYPQQAGFRERLVKFYIDQHRPADAENELRSAVAGDPKNSQAEFELIRFLYTEKGAAAARVEIVARIGAGGDTFPYKMALAELDYNEGNTKDGFDLLSALANDGSSPEHTLLAKMKLAEFDINSKNFDAADKIVSEVLGDDSALKLHASALRLRALIRLDRGQLNDAIFDLREALESRPRSSDLKLLLATAYERSGAIELAEKQLSEALRDSNFNPTVGLAYASFKERHGDPERAADILTDLAHRQPDNVAILSALAAIRLTQKDWAGAQEIAETIKRSQQSSAVATADQILGQALAGEQKYDPSITAFEDAVTAAPSAVQPMAALVQALIRAKDTDKAISFLQSVLKSNPANSEAYILLGSVQLARNAPDEAMKDFMMAIEKQPKDAGGYRAVAELYLRENNADAAQLVIRSGLKQLPDSVELHMTLAGILEQAKQYDAAISEYEWVLAQQPGSVIAANNLASLLADHRTDKASLDRAQALAASLRQSPVPQFKDTLGWVSYRTGDFRAAVPLLEQAAAALPDQALIRYHLGMGYAATGQDSKATEELKIALSNASNSELKQKISAELKKLATQ